MVAVASLLRASDDYEEFGATRGLKLGQSADGVLNAPAPAGAIDITRSTTHCVDGGTQPVFWRPATSLHGTYRVSSRGTGAPLAFSGDLADWPAALPLEAGTYRIARANQSGNAAMITLRTEAAETGLTAPERIAWLAGQGCEDQARDLLVTLRQSLSPLALYLDTDRGRQPTYNLGESMTLIAQTNRDAFLYCFYRDSANQVVTLFPSAYSKGAALRGNETLNLPGARLPVTLEFTAPPGREQVQCFATDKDIGAELPAEIVAGTFEVLPMEIGNRLDQIFGEISGDMLAEMRVDLQVR
jgi:hypothetical protein